MPIKNNVPSYQSSTSTLENRSPLTYEQHRER
jgi:hypothetical protein